MLMVVVSTHEYRCSAAWLAASDCFRAAARSSGGGACADNTVTSSTATANVNPVVIVRCMTSSSGVTHARTLLDFLHVQRFHIEKTLRDADERSSSSDRENQSTLQPPSLIAIEHEQVPI